MRKLLFYIFYAFLWLLTLLPLSVLFLLSDLCFVLIYSVFRYRRKIVMNNLNNAFPEKTEQEKKKIARRFYLHLCDYFFETIKLIHLSEKDIQKRMALDGNCLKFKEAAKRHVIVMLGHNGNWEWLSGVGLKDNHQWVAPYHPLQNSPYFDHFMYQLRSRFGALPVPMQQTYKQLMKIDQEKKVFLAGMIADQSPPNPKNRHWITFLNQDTAVMEGSERIAQKTNAAVFFAKMIKIKRGYYKLSFIPISENPSDEEDLFITKKYFELLEEQIREQPECWLWSHRRWKRKRPTEAKHIKL